MICLSRRAQRAQQKHQQKHDVQLELGEEDDFTVDYGEVKEFNEKRKQRQGN